MENDIFIVLSINIIFILLSINIIMDKNKEDYMTKPRSVLGYLTNKIRYENKDECKDFTPPFVAYVPIGVPKVNLDIENDLKGMTRLLSRANIDKYQPKEFVDNKKMEVPTTSNKECDNNMKILPNGYIVRKLQ